MSFSSDFARAYDSLNDGADYAQKAALVASVLEPRDGYVAGLDLGCGTGELSLALCGRYDLTAVDLSEEMLAVAASKAIERGAKICFLRQDIRFLNLGRQFDFGICLQDTLNYLSSYEDLERCFSHVAAHLRPGGKFLFDLSTKERFETVYGDLCFFLERKNLKCVWESAYHKRKRTCDFRFTLFLREPDGRYRCTTEEETQSYFDPERVCEIASRAGLSAPEILSEDPAERVIFLCEKKG